MTKWEYKVIEVDFFELEKIEKTINDLGKQGWEHYSTQSKNANSIGLLFFKRPIQ